MSGQLSIYCDDPSHDDHLVVVRVLTLDEYGSLNVGGPNDRSRYAMGVDPEGKRPVLDEVRTSDGRRIDDSTSGKRLLKVAADAYSRPTFECRCCGARVTVRGDRLAPQVAYLIQAGMTRLSLNGMRSIV